MISIEEFKKVDFRIGEVKLINDKIEICVSDKKFLINIKLNIEENDKIIIILHNNKIIIPVFDKNIPIIPEKDIETGSKVR